MSTQNQVVNTNTNVAENIDVTDFNQQDYITLDEDRLQNITDVDLLRVLLVRGHESKNDDIFHGAKHILNKLTNPVFIQNKGRRFRRGRNNTTNGLEPTPTQTQTNAVQNTVQNPVQNPVQNNGTSVNPNLLNNPNQLYESFLQYINNPQNTQQNTQRQSSVITANSFVRQTGGYDGRKPRRNQQSNKY